MQDAIKYLFLGIGIGTAIMGWWVFYCLAQFTRKGEGMNTNLRYYQNTNDTIIFEGVRCMWRCDWLTRWEKVKLTLLPRIRGKR